MAVKKKSNIKKKVVKKASPKPRKVSSKPKIAKKTSTKKPEFDKAWKEYNSALSGWKESLAQWQKATNETLMTYHDACQKAIQTVKISFKENRKLCKNHYKLFKNKDETHIPIFFKASKF